MRGGLSSRGYTIVEVMVFLSISGVMFLMAITFISGKQAKSEFRQSMNELNTQIQQVIGDVSNGFYPSNNDFSCSSAATGNPMPGALTNQQGTNLGCVFMGKVVQFDVADASGTPDPTAYNIYSVAGRQYAPNTVNTPPAKFSQAEPILVTSPKDLTASNSVQWGSQVTAMYDGTPAIAIGAIGFFGSFGQQPGGNVQSGSQTTIAVPIPGSGLGQQKSALVNLIATPSEASLLDSKLAAEPNPANTAASLSVVRPARTYQPAC
jgi:type II secretory pathway pseudopilin PulG